MRVVRVGDVAEQVRGVTFGKSDSSSSPKPGLVAVLRAGNLIDGRLILKDLVYVPAKYVKPKQLVQVNDVIVAASSGSLSVVGKAARCSFEFEGAFGAFLKVLRPSSQVDPAYFAHYFQTPQYRRKMSSLAAGANINNLKSEHLDELEIPLPVMGEQRRIAAILDQADSFRARRQHVLAHAENLAVALFARATSGQSLQHAPLGDLAEVRSSLVNPTGKQYQAMAHIGPDSIWPGTSRLSGWRTVAEDGVTSGKYQFLAGDVLYSKIRPYLNKVVIAPFDGLCSADMYAMRVDQNLIAPEFLEFSLRSREFLAYAEGLSNRANIPKLNRNQLQAYVVALPPISAQREFANGIRTIRNWAATVEHSAQSFDQLFTSLQFRAFRGEL